MGRFKDSMHDTILGEQISDNIYLDNNGQLICENVVLARTGYYDYREDELLDNGSPDKIVKVFRSPEEVFDEESIKSMNYKPLVDEHPEDNVTPETVGTLQKGFMINVRRGTGEFANCLMADLVVTDPYVIDLIRSGKKRELSVGYTADIEDKNGQFIMKNIRGNHIALCEAGRAGNARIRDSRVKLCDATVEAKGSFNSIDDLKKFYNDAIISLDGDKIMVGMQGVKLLYSFVNGNKEGKVIFVRKLNDAKVKPADEVVAEEKYLKGSEDNVADADYLESLREMIRYEKPNTKAELRKVYNEWVAKEHHGAGYQDEFLKMCKEFNIEDAKLPDPADEKELDRTHFIPDSIFADANMSGRWVWFKYDEVKGKSLIQKIAEKYKRNYREDVNITRLEKHYVPGKKELEIHVFANDMDDGSDGFWAVVSCSENEAKTLRDSIEENKELEKIYKDSLRPFRVSVGGRKFDTMATSFADAVQKVRSTLRDADFGSIKDQNELKDLLLAKKYKITFKHGKNSSGDDLDRYTAIHEKDGKGFQWVYNSSKKTMTPVLYKDLKGGEKTLNSIREVKAVLGDSISDAELIAKNKELTGSINDVYPNEGESKEDFISRFMSATKEEYPDKDQRLAVAYAYWKKGVKDSSSDVVERFQKEVDYAIKHFGRIGGGLYDELDENGLWVDDRGGKFIVKKKVKDSKTVTYKGYAIEFDFYGQKEYTVQYQGDDVWFKSESKAKKFIDDIVSGKITDSKLKDSFAILHPTRNEFLSVGGRSWVKEDSNNIQKFSSYGEAKEFGEKYIDHQFRIFKFFDAKHVIDHDVEETTEDVANAPKSFQLREFVGNLIDDEVEAVQGYDETLLRTDLDEETRKTLEEIRNDELDHTNKLNAIYRSLTKDPKPVGDAGMVGYLFPKLNRNDLLNAYKYGLGLGAINPFKGEEGTFLLGSLENIKKYAKDYLDYELVKGYLVKGESLTGN